MASFGIASLGRNGELGLSPLVSSGILNEYLSPQRRTQEAILLHLCDYAHDKGVQACIECPYREGSDNRDALLGTREYNFYPECKEPGQGILIPQSHRAINRLIQAVSDEEKAYMRQGRKPEEVNEVWFGDHHQFDVFVVDEHGKPVRPWLTAWYDMASGCLVGWCISLNPNSRTITQAFTRAAAEKRTIPFMGVPVYVYVDNGKDYRCEALEGERLTERSLGRLNMDLGKRAIYDILSVQVIHAKEYHGWAKPVERWFRTLEERYCRELPGYCGGSPEARPENFGRMLDKQLERGELLSMDELYTHFVEYILPAYHTTPHSGYAGEKPLERYHRLPKARKEVPSWSILAPAKEETAERVVSTQGTRFRNRLYWDFGIAHMAGKSVLLRYDRDDLQSITVCTMPDRENPSRFICECEPKETLAMVGEEEEKVARHVAMQRLQERQLRERISARGVKLPGKRSSGNLYYEEIDPKFARGNMSSIEAERVIRAKEEAKQRRLEQKEIEEGRGRVSDMFMRMHEDLKGTQ